MTRSNSGYWPCETCPDHSAPAYNDDWGIVVPYRNTQPCRVKPSFKQLPVYNLTVCMEGSNSNECISRRQPVLSSKVAYFACSENSGTRAMQWDWHYVRNLIGMSLSNYIYIYHSNNYNSICNQDGITATVFQVL